MRYADEFITMTEYEEEAKTVYEALEERLAKFELEIAKDKRESCRLSGTARRTTFNFLGVLLVNEKTRNEWIFCQQEKEETVHQSQPEKVGKR